MRESSQIRDTTSYYSRASSLARSRSQSPVDDLYSRPWSSASQYDNSSSYTSRTARGLVGRDSLFTDFVSTLPSSSTESSSVYNKDHMDGLKDQFQNMIQDNWKRKQLNDPRVSHDMALKASGWSNYLGKKGESAGEILGRKHHKTGPPTPFRMPRITIYHSSTQ